MATVHILDVFVDLEGNYGGGLGVVLDDHRVIADAERKSITRQLGYEETVFVNDLKLSDVSVYTPQREVPFAGQPMIGTAWLLGQLNDEPIQTIHCLGGTIDTWRLSELTWVRAKLDIMPPWNIKQLPGPKDVESLVFSNAEAMPHTLAWAWADEARGKIRARTFAVDWDIPFEVETNGSGSMILASKLKRNVQIQHGKGSIIYAKPVGTDHAALGGRVKERQVVGVKID